MTRFCDPGFLRTVPPVGQSTDLRSFHSAKSKAAEILWNVDPTGYHVLSLPSITTIEEIVRNAVRDILRLNWDHYVLRPALGESPAPLGRTLRADMRQLVRRIGSSRESVEMRRKRIMALCPKNLEQACNVCEFLFLQSAGNVSAIAPSENGISDPVEWLNHFYGIFWPRATQKARRNIGMSGRQKPNEFKGRWGIAIVVASELRARRMILAPQNIIYHVSRNLATQGRRTCDALIDFMQKRLPRMSDLLIRDFGTNVKYSKISSAKFQKLKVRAMDLGYSTSLESVDEISWQFADGFASPSASNYHSYVAVFPSWLREKALAVEGPTRAVGERADPFYIQIQKYQKLLPEWCDAIRAFRNTIVVKKALERGRLFLPLLEWASTCAELETPISVRRHHIRDDLDREAMTFRRALANREISSKTKNAMLHNAAAFFEYLVKDHPRFKNPIDRKMDTFARQIGESLSIGKTYRKRILGYVLDDLKEFLVPQHDGGFAWGEWVTRYETVTIKGEEVFCPLRPAIIVLLATFPLRINQVRWLDSGEKDECTYDYENKTFGANSLGILGRTMGVLQPAMDDEFSGIGSFLDLQIAINKRPIGDRGDYTIPYVDDRTLWIICEVLRWQERHGCLPQLVREADAPYEFTLSQDDLAREKMPELCPLFRDPRHRGMFPPSYNSMKGFWKSVCVAYDRHNAEWIDPKTGEKGRAGWQRLSKTVTKERATAVPSKRGMLKTRQILPKDEYRYDLYSLKVGSVSHLIARGIPLACVSAMAGHGCLAMTLRYFVLDRTEMRRKLSELAKSNPDHEARPSAIEARLQGSLLHSDWLVGNSPVALTALQRAVREGKSFMISTTGICPNARCDEGLELKYAKSDGGRRAAFVPGSLCGLCKFRVYGPPFLIGLGKEFNELIYTLTELAQHQQNFRARHRALEAEGRHDEAIVCRNEDEELSRRAEPDCAHAARLYEMINESIKLAEGRNGSATGKISTLIAQQLKIRAVVEPVGQFEQWKEILEMAEILPGARSLVPEQVGVRMQNKLMGVLARNGAKPFLAILPERIAKQASLEFAQLLERAIPSDKEREDVFAGRRLLRDLGKDVETSLLEAAEVLDRKYGALRQIEESLSDHGVAPSPNKNDTRAVEAKRHD